MRFSQVLRALPLVCGTMSAQSYTVSPAYYGVHQGNVVANRPLGLPSARWQQAHGDLRGAPKQLTAIALRKGLVTASAAGPRRTELALVCAASRLSAWSATFASNYVGTPVTVLARTTVHMPSWAYSQATPEPWTVVLPFTTPFPYSGQDDLLWELLVFSNTGGYYPADAYDRNQADRTNATIHDICCGCRVTGNPSTITQSVAAYTLASTRQLYFGVTLQHGRPNSPAGIIVGLANPDLVIPGLCAKLFSDGLWTLPWATDSAGELTLPAFAVGFDPSWVGRSLYVQTLLPDAMQPGLPLALSQGQRVVIPAFEAGSATILGVWANDPNAIQGSLGGDAHITRLTH